jgi:hypothetical protein
LAVLLLKVILRGVAAGLFVFKTSTPWDHSVVV